MGVGRTGLFKFLAVFGDKIVRPGVDVAEGECREAQMVILHLVKLLNGYSVVLQGGILLNLGSVGSVFEGCSGGIAYLRCESPS